LPASWLGYVNWFIVSLSSKDADIGSIAISNKLKEYGRIEEEHVNSCWMTLREREDTVNCKRQQHLIAICGELSWEEAVGMNGQTWKDNVMV
jgi:hypothetical protein